MPVRDPSHAELCVPSGPCRGSAPTKLGEDPEAPDHPPQATGFDPAFATLVERSEHPAGALRVAEIRGTKRRVLITAVASLVDRRRYHPLAELAA